MLDWHYYQSVTNLGWLGLDWLHWIGKKWNTLHMGKRLKNDQKYAILQNWPKTRPKVLNAQNKRVLHHFGGMLALKSGLRFFVSALSVPFFGT